MNSNINSEGKRNRANPQLRGLTQPLFTSTFRKRKKKQTSQENFDSKNKSEAKTRIKNFIY